MNNLRLLHLGLDNLFSTTKLNLQVFNSLANCTQLELLYLNDNQLAGKLPTSVANHSTHPLEFCIGNNFLTGSIPQGFERFQNLLALDVHQIFHRLLDIIEMYLAHNELSGSPPALVGILERLEVLDASNNQLSRNISTTIGSCLSLCTFNIATNKLSGSIPVSMDLKFVFKDLEGPVPRKGVFMNLTWLSHTGNNKLCGSDPEATRKLRIPTCITKVKSNRHLILKIVIPVASFALLMCAALKVIDLQQGEASENFNAECEVLRNIQHRNLVKYPEDTDSGLALTLIQRLNIAIDVASALNYLHHDCDPPVVHCDLKPANVLLDDNMGAHVGDFGLARFLWKNPSEDESSTIGLKGSIECGLGSRISTSRDVYSIGISQQRNPQMTCFRKV
ncbi:putative LRR receptor-like serine/threonine-protein kinase [Vitis vinifera]|uniref:Putative LRR receptor-like serine/threonine-protein kinase n=1 Tax=Vitis vinifera TaxID=29760 RepID=A0A438HKT9_VITVI|nr:putative LRR receptor-like serine/threonine-protein kinase [Vitis vinifera]